MTPQLRRIHLEYARNEGRLVRILGKPIPLWFISYMNQEMKLTKREVTSAFRHGWRNP